MTRTTRRPMTGPSSTTGSSRAQCSSRRPPRSDSKARTKRHPSRTMSSTRGHSLPLERLNLRRAFLRQLQKRDHHGVPQARVAGLANTLSTFRVQIRAKKNLLWSPLLKQKSQGTPAKILPHWRQPPHQPQWKHSKALLRALRISTHPLGARGSLGRRQRASRARGGMMTTGAGGFTRATWQAAAPRGPTCLATTRCKSPAPSRPGRGHSSREKIQVPQPRRRKVAAALLPLGKRALLAAAAAAAAAALVVPTVAVPKAVVRRGPGDQ
mmetsp:Transcript_59261/g.134169  ORF Transcript_59261/g.134169 Transcript_59261/m.134169 type:complete len:268 (-) Transcript_59261:691-1494(-)